MSRPDPQPVLLVSGSTTAVSLPQSWRMAMTQKLMSPTCLITTWSPSRRTFWTESPLAPPPPQPLTAGSAAVTHSSRLGLGGTHTCRTAKVTRSQVPGRLRGLLPCGIFSVPCAPPACPCIPGLILLACPCDPGTHAPVACLCISQTHTSSLSLCPWDSHPRPIAVSLGLMHQRPVTPPACPPNPGTHAPVACHTPGLSPRSWDLCTSGLSHRRPVPAILGLTPPACPPDPGTPSPPVCGGATSACGGQARPGQDVGGLAGLPSHPCFLEPRLSRGPAAHGRTVTL